MAIKKSLLRKPQARKQGIKILCFGVDGSGKSVFGLSFPEVAVIDTESKVGVYENNPKYNKNLVAVADTSNYYDTLDIIQEVVDNNLCKTLMIDSETYIKESLEVACMEVEEARAAKKGGNIDDQTISMRGYGKIKLNSNRMRLLKAQASAKGITIISTAHKEDIMQKVGSEQVKVGEKPALRKNAQHDYDVILRFYKERNMATGAIKFLAEVEKDTTCTFPVGTILENASYDLFKEFMEANDKLKSVDTQYGGAIENEIAKMTEENKTFDDTVKEFVELFKALKAKDESNTAKVQALLQEKGIKSYKDQETAAQLTEVVAILKTM